MLVGIVHATTYFLCSYCLCLDLIAVEIIDYLSAAVQSQYKLTSCSSVLSLMLSKLL